LGRHASINGSSLVHCASLSINPLLLRKGETPAQPTGSSDDRP
jgi:hypothetical protein